MIDPGIYMRGNPHHSPVNACRKLRKQMLPHYRGCVKQFFGEHFACQTLVERDRSAVPHRNCSQLR